MVTDTLKIALVSPSSTFTNAELERAYDQAASINIVISQKSATRVASPIFLNGHKDERLNELKNAEKLGADAIWSTRGGCGAIELWQDYSPEIYQHGQAPLIGYSDITLLHLMRFERARRIGIHGPVFFDIKDEARASFSSIRLLIDKKAHKLVYPPLRNLNRFLFEQLEGELIVMNLMMLQCAIGAVAPGFLRGSILALEDINEPHYKVFRAMNHLKNAGLLAGIKALIIGHFNLHRDEIIRETMVPMAEDLGIPIFDWPIFGHDKPNWPLLFGARTRLRRIDQDLFSACYLQQHDQSPIPQDY